MPDWIPNLSNKVDPQVDQAIRYLFQAVYALRDGKSDGGKGSTSTPTKVGGDLIGTTDNALLIRKGPGPGKFTGFTTITIDENGRVIAIS